MGRESRPTQPETLLAALRASGPEGIATNVLRSQYWIGNPSERRADLERSGHRIVDRRETSSSGRPCKRYWLEEFAPPELRGAAAIAMDDDGQTRLAA